MSDTVISYVSRACMECGQVSIVEVNADALKAWKSGQIPIEQAFPNMNADEREVLITGTHSECWTKMFGEED
jgi:hypothetical protein